MANKAANKYVTEPSQHNNIGHSTISMELACCNNINN